MDDRSTISTAPIETAPVDQAALFAIAFALLAIISLFGGLSLAVG